MSIKASGESWVDSDFDEDLPMEDEPVDDSLMADDVGPFHLIKLWRIFSKFEDFFLFFFS
jgi:hypothetical protein